MKKFGTIAIFLLVLSVSCTTITKDMNLNVEFSNFPELIAGNGQQNQPGLAGPITGVISDYLIIAGGSNFPDSLPWHGGTKTYYDQVYYVNTNNIDSGWKISTKKLNEPLAYSACVTVDNKIICVGGENQDGPTSRIIMISKHAHDFDFQEQTKLPFAVSNAGIANIDSKIYIAGGTGVNGALSSFYCADITTDSMHWSRLPEIPLPLSHAVVVNQWDGSEQCIYVLGGRNKTSELTEFFSAVWKYSPAKNKWTKCGEITKGENEPFALTAGTGVAVGENSILLFGGDHGTLFNKTEDFINRILKENETEKKSELVKQKNSHLQNHPGFDRVILIYNTLTNVCQQMGTLPHAAQLTTTAVKNDNNIFIPSGEVKPGIRTPEVTCLKVSKSRH
ncbi:hypothetical protein OU798_12610 [Prolixibacteraceae bacterium Z1-6]|uniref:Cyclically-permuted mutarotase family protein n=1 Tax=Draconibacterium aestuarii TaxID=2998507 RepID=A0A9X3F7E7_9BACT|nr:hypothetical protein [Prolixibacteraceae bacterium Z1-6]